MALLGGEKQGQSMADLLTIVVIAADAAAYENENKEWIAAIRSDGHKLLLQEEKDLTLSGIQKIIDETPSGYLWFYNEKTQMDRKAIGHIREKVSELGEDMVSFSFAKEKFPVAGRMAFGGEDRNLFSYSRYIFKAEYLKSLLFSDVSHPFPMDELILKATAAKEDCLVFPGTKLETEELLEEDLSKFDKQFYKEWYLAYFEDFLIPYAKRGNLSPTENRMLFYCIIMRFKANHNTAHKFVLSEEEIDLFFGLVDELVSLLDDACCYEVNRLKNFYKFFPYMLLQKKYDEHIHFSVKRAENSIQYFASGVLFNEDCVIARVKAMNVLEEKLVVDGMLVGDYCLDDVRKDLKIYYDGKEVHWKATEVYNRDFFFGRFMYRYQPFQFEIPVKDLKVGKKITFYAIIDGEKIKLPLEFVKNASRITRSRWNVWRFTNELTIRCADDSLLIGKYERLKSFVREAARLASIYHANDEKEVKIQAIKINIANDLTRGRYKKPIWIFFDKLYKAGDNGDYLFRYCMEHYPEVDCYYLLNDTANEYKSMKKQYGRHILAFGTLHQQLVALNADIIFATHAGVWSYCGFSKIQKYFREIFKADIVCIQHGLTIQNIEQYQNRLADNLKDYFCAAQCEIENLRQPVYGYEKDELHLTGLPRFDGLFNRDIKQILITPTWRRNIVITGNAFGTTKEYNPLFKETEYFKIYNRLINDERIIASAKKNGYKMLFLLHPTLGAQIDDYDKNDYVKILPAVSEISYEQILTESSLMVTDYSGVQFDFAYMKKPLLYYQPKELPPQYTQGVFSYEENGFGPIIEEYEEMVASLCDYMDRGCVMEEAYMERVDTFFAYTDHNNCQRIMKVIEEKLYARS